MEKWNSITEEIKPEIGQRIHVDSWSGIGWTVLSESNWDRAEFRAKTNGTDIELAVNITVTGRTHQWPFGSGSPRAVRMQIEFINDDGPSTFSRGWLITRDF